MSAIPLRAVVLPADLASAADVLMREIEDMYRGRHAIAPVMNAAQARDLPETVPEAIGVVLSTSGSTGTPKRTMLSRTALLASYRASSHRLGGDGSWLLCVPPWYVAGFQVVSRAVLAGTRLTTLDGDRFDAAGFAGAAYRMGLGRRYTALVPTQIKRLLADGRGRAALAGFHKVLIGGAPLDSDTAALLRRVADVVVTYGMTETAGGCVYDGRPLAGVEVRIVEGVIHIGGDVVASGYLDAADPRPSQGPGQGPGQGPSPFYLDDQRRCFVTADRGRWVAGRLVPLGRMDDLINTGGLKVSAGAVERVLAGAEGVDGAVVMALPDHEWGELVGAYVVPRPGLPAPRVDLLKERIRQQLGRAAVPKKIVVSEDLPLLANFKVDRRTIRERLMKAPMGAGDRLREVDDAA